MTTHNTYQSPICVYIDAIEDWIIYSTILIYIASVDSLSLAFVASVYAAAPTLLPRLYPTEKIWHHDKFHIAAYYVRYAESGYAAKQI